MVIYHDGSSDDFAGMLIAETANLPSSRETATFDRTAVREGGVRFLDSV
jgi:predicted nucleic-acid-binding protein